jgi:ElaB/YqjD/DUF883 family membrane-anchored ribosome-binding protein
MTQNDKSNDSNSPSTTTPGTGMGSAVARAVDHASGNLHQAIDRVTGVTQPALNHMASSAHQVVDQVNQATSQAAEHLETKAAHWCGMQDRLKQQCRQQVANRPFTALGIALATGLVLSWFIKSR